MTDRDAMIEAVWEIVRAEAHCTNFWHEIPAWKRKAETIITALEPFILAREQAAREEGRKQERGEIVEWLRNRVNERQSTPPESTIALGLADAIERNEHREHQDG